MTNIVKFCKLDENAIIPTLGTDGSGGFDLYAKQYTELHQTSLNIIDTGIGCIIPKGYVGIIKPRSGLTIQCGLDTKAGVIDSDYRGPIKVIIHDLGTGPLGASYIENKERMAQLLILKCETEHEEIDINEFNSYNTDRGDGGFGSTGN